MIPALVIKELRETAGIGAIALAIALVYAGSLTGSVLFGWLSEGQSTAPVSALAGSSSLVMLALFAAAVGTALGFRQSAWELSRGTALFLFHRPVPRRRIVFLKLATGLGVYLLCTLLPLLLYLLWAATPGTHGTPFFWSMTIPPLFVFLAMPLVYLGAFASGWRDARWFGSRLLPLAGAGLLAMLALIAPLSGLPTWWPALLVPVAIGDAWLISVILAEVRQRDL